MGLLCAPGLAGGEMVKFPRDVARASLRRYPFAGNYMRHMANVGTRRPYSAAGSRAAIGQM